MATVWTFVETLYFHLIVYSAKRAIPLFEPLSLNYIQHRIYALSLSTEIIIVIMYWCCCGRQIGYHPDFESSRCLFIVRKDGELVDFSYWKCIKGLIRKKYPLHAESFILRHFRRRRRNFRR